MWDKNTNEKVRTEGWVYVKVCKGMYGLLQAGLLGQELLTKRLTTYGYTQSIFTPSLWTCKKRPIQFCLVVDNFGVKYSGKEQVLHLKMILEQHYKLSTDWTGKKCVRLQLSGITTNVRYTFKCQTMLSECWHAYNITPMKTSAPTTIPCAIKLWTKTLCETRGQHSKPQQETDQIHPRGYWHILILYTGCWQHHAYSPMCNRQWTNETHQKHTGENQAVPNKPWSNNHIPCQQHDPSST